MREGARHEPDGHEEREVGGTDTARGGRGGLHVNLSVPRD